MKMKLTRENVIRWAPALVLLGLVVLFTAINPAFLSQRNLARIALASTPPMMVALGVTFIIVMGSIDLSMEGAVSLCAVLFCLLFLQLGGSLGAGAWLAIPAILVCGAFFGWLTGMVHVRLQIPSFMASLAMGFVGTGAAVLVTGGDIVRIDDDVFRALLTWRILGFPLMVHIAALLVLLAWFIQNHTTLGRNFYAVGGGEELAHASGVNVRRVRLAGFALAFARGVGEYGSVIFIAGNLPNVSEIAPLLIVIRLSEFRYADATAIAVVMLVASFLIIFLINRLQRWAQARIPVH